MKIPGWWRVRHLYINTNQGIRSSIKGKVDDFKVWKASQKKIKRGINLIGFAKGDFGIAEHLRLVTNSISTTKIKICVNNALESGDHTLTNEELSPYITVENPYRINLFCYNSNFILHYMNSYNGKIAKLKHYNIGYGYWELSVYPSEWEAQNEFLNEIWAPSRFIKEVVEKSTNLPVVYMPIPVDFKLPVGFSRKQFKLPENKFLFLFTFDMQSFVTRKNPYAVISAFINAFPVEKNESVSLVIKINRVQSNKDHDKLVDKLRGEIAFDLRIIILDVNLDRSSILGLINVCDSYVSLHRAEGFGLGMAEAMKMGKLVIGTNYSGNTDFMTSENSCLVSYKLVEVHKDEYAHVEEGAMWAEPDIKEASSYMKRAYEEPAFVKKIGEAAKLYIDTHHNFNIIGEKYQKRYDELMNKFN